MVINCRWSKARPVSYASDKVFLKTFDARPTGGAAALTSPCRPLEVTGMQGQVAVATQRDQVLLRIIPGLTAKFLEMKEVLQARAGLTSPW